MTDTSYLYQYFLKNSPKDEKPPKQDKKQDKKKKGGKAQ